MTNNRFQDWSKRTERIQKQALNAPSVWDNSVEEEQKTIEEVKQQWQNKQHQQFKRIQKQENEHQNIKIIVSSLVSFTLIAIAVPNIPAWWQMGKNSFAELFPEDTEANSGNQPIKGGFLDKIKKLQQKQANKENNQENSLKEDGTVKKEGGKATIADQLEESVDNIDNYNQNLQKAIDISDGKEASLEKEKK
ncbi:hypothetical protein [Geminocystis herdmanii]|uniref:hypothetical protein n=1 Tax=Geminocystis herdmanii TaxID=669359 RepID=UPI00034BB244|nr:hypothetical protein [Geminocystis herdmanii]